jgi:TetR/AcrR family transcriptional regulator, regulator of mycofactocin system
MLTSPSDASKTWKVKTTGLFSERADAGRCGEAAELSGDVAVLSGDVAARCGEAAVLSGEAAVLSGDVAAAAPRRGRPPGTSRRELELIALRLFTEQGFDNTTIDQISTEAGVNKRTFFRYFGSKASVLWSEFDTEVGTIREALADVPAEVPMMDAIRRAVVAANHYQAQDVAELRMRMNLIGSVPALQSSAAIHYDAWERAISDFAAVHIGQPADSLYPLAVGRATLAACRAAYDRWSTRADADLTFYLDAALAALTTGFEPAKLSASAKILNEQVGGRPRRPRS